MKSADPCEMKLSQADHNVTNLQADWDQTWSKFVQTLKIFHAACLRVRKLFLSVIFCPCLSALNTTCNNIDEFECGNGDCVNYTLTCDGMAHCKDKSDEKQSYCGE